MRPVIIVSGLPRSGTSMMMRMLDAGGIDVYTDHIRKPDTERFFCGLSELYGDGVNDEKSIDSA